MDKIHENFLAKIRQDEIDRLNSRISDLEKENSHLRNVLSLMLKRIEDEQRSNRLESTPLYRSWKNNRKTE